ncbi:MAG: hypothetical protein ACI843_000297 [Psychrobacter glaciei]|jgi:hypothetical protein
MNMDIIKTFPKQELADLGFLCATYGLTEECESISDGIAAVYETSPLPFLLKAILQLNLENPILALKLLRDDALPLDPKNPTIKVLIGFTYIQLGQYKKGHSLLKSFSNENDNSDTSSRMLALEFLAA